MYTLYIFTEKSEYYQPDQEFDTLEEAKEALEMVVFEGHPRNDDPKCYRDTRHWLEHDYGNYSIAAYIKDENDEDIVGEQIFRYFRRSIPV